MFPTHKKKMLPDLVYGFDDSSSKFGTKCPNHLTKLHFFFQFFGCAEGGRWGGGVKYQNFPNSVNNPYKPFYEYFLCIHVLSAQCTFECSILDIFKNMLKKKRRFYRILSPEGDTTKYYICGLTNHLL